ncbi:MAG: GNAT family N-acetyltransferase [Opitutus sp.]
MTSYPVALAESDSAIAACFPVMHQLRPHLIADQFVPQVRRMERQGYRLAYATDPSGQVRAVAGFREMEMLFSGPTMYVDDLVTDVASRSQGYGDQLIDWLVARARAGGIQEFSLDSGTQRVDAHRFYLRKRMKISCFHFSLPLRS